MTSKGFVISLDAFLAILLLSGAIVFFASQPFFNPPTIQTAIRTEQNLSDVFDTLENSGFLTQQLVNRQFDKNSVINIYDEAKRLVGESTEFKLRVTEYIPAENLDDCKTGRVFADCFPAPTAFEYQTEPLPDADYVRDKKILAKHRPFPEPPSDEDVACVTLKDQQFLQDTFGLYFQEPPPLILDFNTTLNPTETECDAPVNVTIQARNEARDPVAVMLVMDKSGSMSQMDMVYQETDSTVSGQSCQRQVQDESGNGHHANNFNVTSTAGRIGSLAAHFNGSAYLEAPPHAQMSDVYSVSVWVNPTDFSNCGTLSHLRCTITARTSAYYGLAVDNLGKIYIGGHGSSSSTNVQLLPNRWTHLVLTVDASRNVLLYMDNTTAYSFGGGGTVSSPPFHIGGFVSASAGPTQFFTGQIDDVRVYNRVLSSAEMSALFNNVAPPSNGLVVHYDFEDLDLDPNVACFYNAGTSEQIATNCGDAGNQTLFPVSGGIDPDYTDFFPVTSFDVTPAEQVYASTVNATLRVLMDRPWASGTCMVINGAEAHKAPFLRVQKPDFTYFNYIQANRVQQTSTATGTYQVQVWNEANFAFNTWPNSNADVNVYRDYQATNLITASSPVAPTAFESELKGPFVVANALSLTGEAIECGQETDIGWKNIGSFDLSDPQTYYLDFNVFYSKTGVVGTCGPHLRVTRPDSSTLTTIACSNAPNSQCGLALHAAERVAGARAQTGRYDVYIKTDENITLNAQARYATYLPLSQPNVANDDPARRCVYANGNTADGWQTLGTFSYTATQNVYSDSIRVNYQYPHAYCRPQIRVVRPNGSVNTNYNCNVGTLTNPSANCDIYSIRSHYSNGPYAQDGTYEVQMRTPLQTTLTLTASPAAVYNTYFDFRQLLYKIKRPGSPTVPGVSGFVGGGTCMNAPCSATTIPALPTRTNCPNVNTAYDGNRFLLSRNPQTIGQIDVTSQDSIRRIRAQVSAATTGSVCLGGAVGFENAVTPNSLVRFPFAPRNSSAAISYGVNVTGTDKNIMTTIPVPTGTYAVRGWDNESTDFSVDWFLERIDYAKIASRSFIDQVSWQPEDRLGMVAFSTLATTSVPLTDDTNLVKAGINALIPDGETAIGDALEQAISELEAHPEIGQKFIILLTDGRDTDNVPDPIEMAAVAERKGIVVYTIGFGSNVNDAQLRQIALIAHGQYVYAEDAQDLENAFNFLSIAIQQSIGQANVNLVIPKGMQVDNYQCQNTSGTPCTGTAADPTCECSEIIFSEQENGDGQLTFRNAQVQKVDPNWWEATFDLTVKCDGPRCNEETIWIPDAGSNVTNISGTPSVNWTPQGQALLRLKPKDLALRITGNINSASTTANLKLVIENRGALNVTLEDRTQVSCVASASGTGGGIEITVSNTDPRLTAPDIRKLCTSERGLCGSSTCDTAADNGYPNTHTIDVLNFPLGYTTISIDPRGANAPIFECTANNTVNLSCLKNPETGYYVLEYWSWRT